MYRFICKSRPVRPVRHRTLYFPPVDLQALPPFGWCKLCGGEVYFQGQDFCPRCRRGR